MMADTAHTAASVGAHLVGERGVASAKKPATDHLAAIHTLARLCRMSEADYRALLRQLTGKDSAKLCTLPERAKVREHLLLLAARMGVGRFDQSARYKSQTRPTERKVWALWYALGKAGRLDNPSPAALHHWVHKITGVAHLRWTSEAQRQRLIESMKLWLGRA